MNQVPLGAADKRATLREQLDAARLLRYPGAFSPLVARMIEELGFEGVYVSGAALSADLALPDVGLTTQTEVAGRSGQITASTNLPVLVDADTGFGEPLNVACTITTLEQTGLAGCHIEDQINPKRCGHLDRKQVVTREEMVKRLRAAVAARHDDNFVICARTDARGVEGLKAAIERARAYAAAGADLIFPEALADEREFEAFRGAIDVPLLANMTEFGKTPHRLPDSCQPMDTLRTAVSPLGAEDPAEDDNSAGANQAKALAMMAKLPTALAFEYRRRHDLERVTPDSELGFAENFLQMCFGEVPAPEVVRCFEISLVLYAEHSFNASTFTARVVASTLSDVYSAVTAAIGALKGPLHGGANEAVMHMMLEIGDPAIAADWLTTALAEKRKIMGFGHRVYKHGDSRVPTMRAAMLQMAEITEGGQRWVEMYDALEEAMWEAKQIKPNLDFPAGPSYYMMGFDIPLFTPIFMISRLTGWTAHVTEQLEANSLIRPLSLYAGSAQRPMPVVTSRLTTRPPG